MLIYVQIFDHGFIGTRFFVFGEAIRRPAGAKLLLPPLIWLDLHPVHMFTGGALKPAAPQPAANWFPAACGWDAELFMTNVQDLTPREYPGTLDSWLIIGQRALMSSANFYLSAWFHWEQASSFIY